MTLAESIKQEAIRLRIEERRSIDEIRERTGISVGTLSTLLREYPLSTDEVRAKKSEAASRSNPLRKYNPEPSKILQMVNIDELSTESKGRIAEAAVIFRLAVFGYEVLRSTFEGSPVDCFAHRNGSNTVIRIQVK